MHGEGVEDVSLAREGRGEGGRGSQGRERDRETRLLELSEDSQVLLERNTADDLDDSTQVVGGRRVAPACSGFEDEGLAEMSLQKRRTERESARDQGKTSACLFVELRKMEDRLTSSEVTFVQSFSAIYRLRSKPSIPTSKKKSASFPDPFVSLSAPLPNKNVPGE